MCPQKDHVGLPHHLLEDCYVLANLMSHFVAAAYEALSDPEKRRIYDRYGEDGLREHEGRGGGGGGGAADIFSQ